MPPVLARRRKTAPRPGPRPGPGKSHLALAACGIVAALAAGWIVLRPTPHPPALVGRWTTDAPAFAHRALQIDPGVLTLEMGEGKRRTYTIEGVDARQAPGRLPHYVVHYRDLDGTELTLGLQARHPELDELQIDNQPHLWTRARER